MRGEIPPIAKPDKYAFVFKEPVGPVLVIPPWNAALTSTPKQACPNGVLNSLQCDRASAGQLTETLIANERIRKIEFIGSAAVGRIIGATAAKYLKPVLMELGGKCPAIVLDDANLQKADVLCAKGAVLHHGQICFSTERIIVLESVAKQFQQMLVKVMSNEHGGTAAHFGIYNKVRVMLQKAEDQGHEFLVGGPEMVGRNGVKPSIVLIDAKTSKEDLRLVNEETFGPSASLYVVADDKEAVQLANASAYGLNATIHSNNMERAMKTGQELEYGQVHINSISVYTSWTGPQGGVKGSGWGRQNAHWGIEEFLKEKFITYHGPNGGM